MPRSGIAADIDLFALGFILAAGLPACSNGSVGQRAPGDAALVDTGNREVIAQDGECALASYESDASLPPATGPSRFVVRNESSQTIHLQTVGFSGPDYWTIQRAGQNLPTPNTCETCDCSEYPDCSTCGRFQAQVTQIEPSGTHGFDWDGRVWVKVANPCQSDRSCEIPRWVAAGPLAIRVVYSHSSRLETGFGSNDQFLNEPYLAVSTEFNHPAGEVVEIVVNQ